MVNGVLLKVVYMATGPRACDELYQRTHVSISGLIAPRRNLRHDRRCTAALGKGDIDTGVAEIAPLLRQEKERHGPRVSRVQK